jgi:hypothetical protein
MGNLKGCDPTACSAGNLQGCNPGGCCDSRCACRRWIYLLLSEKYGCVCGMYIHPQA